MSTRVISAGFVQDALRTLDPHGIEHGPVLLRAGLPEDVSDRISDVAYGRMWREISAAQNDEFMGLAKRAMLPGSFALMCHALMSTRTFGHALRRSLNFLRVVLEEPSGTLTVRDGEARIEMHSGDRRYSAFAYRTFWLILLGVNCWMIRRQIPLRQLDFACPAPPNRSEYLEFFGAPVRFDQEVGSLTFSSEYLSLPVVREEAALRSFLKAAPGNILLRYKCEEGLSVQIRQRLRQTPPRQWPTFDEIAGSMNVSPATLRRRLKAEGHLYGAIKNELRSVQALKLLRDTDMTVTKVSETLGYSEPSAFHRAFRQWSDVNPAQYRQEARRHKKDG